MPDVASTDQGDSHKVRERLVEALNLDLIGPDAGIAGRQPTADRGPCPSAFSRQVPRFWAAIRKTYVGDRTSVLNQRNLCGG